MTKKLIVGLFLLMTVSAAAQHLQMKIGGGFASHYKDAHIVGAFKAALGCEFELNQHWTVTPWLVAYGKGWKDKDRIVPYFDEHGNPILNPDGTQRTGVMARKTSANYLEVPVMLNYYWRIGESRYIVASVGPYVAMGISGYQKTEGDATQEGGRKVFYKNKTFKVDGIHRFDAGLALGLGYQMAAHITVGIETNLGLTSFDKSNNRNVTGLITLGYQF